MHYNNLRYRDFENGRFVQNINWSNPITMSVAKENDRVVILTPDGWKGDLYFGNLTRNFITTFITEVQLTNGSGSLVYSQSGLSGSAWVAVVNNPAIRVSNETSSGCNITVYNNDGSLYNGPSIWVSGIVMTAW